MWEQNTDLLAPAHPQPGIELATWVCALTRNETGNLLLLGTVPNQLSYNWPGLNYKIIFIRDKNQIINWE